MSVEELNAQTNDAAHVDPGMINTDVSEDDALAAAFDRASGSGSSRDDGGRFKSNADDNAAGDGADEPLEGGEGEETRPVILRRLWLAFLSRQAGAARNHYGAKSPMR